jgi:two-component system, response regulator
VLARNPEPEQTTAAYEAGANTLIAKPVTFLALVKLIKVFTAYWLEAAVLPQDAG